MAKNKRPEYSKPSEELTRLGTMLDATKRQRYKLGLLALAVLVIAALVIFV